MSDYKNKLESLKNEKFKLAEQILRDESIDMYERFNSIDDLYPASDWIIYPFKALAKRELKGKVPDEALPHVRPRYWFMDDVDRHSVITFSGLIDGFSDDVCIAFGDVDVEALSEEELNAPKIKLFSFDNVDYMFSFKELSQHLIEYAIENKVSGITYDW